MQYFRFSRLAAFLLVALMCLSADPAMATGATKWQRLCVGAGGFIRGMDISPNGATRLARTDTYGAYIWNAAAKQWVQLVTSESMPPGLVDQVDGTSATGVYEIKSAPSVPTCLYMAFNGSVYRSINSGRTWVLTGFTPVSNMNANDGYGGFGQKMAVDPVNPNVVYVGTAQNGLWVTTNGGGSFQQVTAVPAGLTDNSGNYPGIDAIVFDYTSGTMNGRTKVIYACSYGNGVYRSGDAGTTWTATSGGPTGASHGRLATDGALYVSAYSQDGSGNTISGVSRYVSGVWTDLTANTQTGGNYIATVYTDPQNPAHVAIALGGGNVDESFDRGATWTGVLTWTTTRVATDIPWLAWTNENYMTCGDQMFDPITPNLVWFAEGIGVWHTILPAAPGTVTWTSQNVGIEQLVANHVISPPGGKPLVSGWDRPVFVIDNPNVYPSKHGPNNVNAIVAGWSIDYASTTPSFIAGIFEFWGNEESGYSTDGGQTWQQFATVPSYSGGPFGGSIAVSTPTNMLWLPSDNPPSPFVTQDGGATWQAVSIPGTTAAGWGWGYYMNWTFACADRVNPGTFYLYNNPGVYRSTDGGKTWMQMYSGNIGYWAGAGAQLSAVPGRAGELYFTNGQQSWGSYPAPYALYHSTDGGATWTAVPNTGEPYAFGFGAPATKGGYPTIYMAGWVNKVWGIWRSTDEAKTWTKIGTFANNSLDQVKTISGDANVFGTVYVGFGGSGWAYGHL